MIRRLKKLEKKLNILIVDGDVSEAEELENELNREFDIVGTVFDGMKAVDEIIRKKPEVVLIDIMLPYIDGVGVIEKAKAALAAGATVVTDTNMALSGVSKATLAKLGGKAVCLMADEQVASEAKVRGVTRAVVSMEHAAKFEGPLLFAIGNAPTALIRLHELIEEGIVAPALVIGVPVGFVNVVEAKELFIGGDTPYIIARGRKGGSNVAASIVNALLYQMVHREGF